MVCSMVCSMVFLSVFVGSFSVFFFSFFGSFQRSEHRSTSEKQPDDLALAALRFAVAPQVDRGMVAQILAKNCVKVDEAWPSEGEGIRNSAPIT